jgi:hypothetical protein
MTALSRPWGKKAMGEQRPWGKKGTKRKAISLHGTTDNLRRHADVRARGRDLDILPTLASFEEADYGELHRCSFRGVVD